MTPLINKPKLQEKVKLKMAGGQLIEAWSADITVSIGGKAYEGKAFVAPVNEAFTLGIDFMHRLGATLNFEKCTFTMGNYSQRY